MDKVIEFFRGWPDTPSPQKAEIAINGNIPTRAHQFCEPFLVANSMGYLLYPPIDFNLYWDGTQTLIQFEGLSDWIIVDKIYLPNSMNLWREMVEPELVDTLPVFLEAFPERGILQLWSGYFANTAPGSSLWIRAPINQNDSNAYSIIEGIVETDWWGGPLFTNIEITKTDMPIIFRKDKPFLQVFTIPKQTHQRDTRPPVMVSDFSEKTPISFYDRMKETANRRNTQNAGSYRKCAKQMRKTDGN